MIGVCRDAAARWLRWHKLALTRNGDEEKGGVIATALVLTMQVVVAQFNGHAEMQRSRGLKKDGNAALSV